MKEVLKKMSSKEKESSLLRKEGMWGPFIEVSNMATDSSFGKMVVFIEVIMKEVHVKEMGSTIMEIARVFVEEYGDGECWKERECIKSLVEQPIE